MKTYRIYHIPTFVHKDGSIGKIGCTTLTVEERAEQQGYIDVELLEEHIDIYIASDREIELQKQYEYKTDDILYWQSVQNRYKNYNLGSNRRDKGHEAHTITLNSNSIHQSNAGKIGGKKTASIIRICQYCNAPIKGPTYFKWHGDKCKNKKS